MIRALFVSGCLVAMACGGGGGESLTPQCTAILIPAVRLTIRDSVSQTIINSQSTVISTRRGDPPDTIVNSPLIPTEMGDHPGTYDLLVKSAGYSDWTRSGIAVAGTDGGCHPVTISVEAELQRQP